MTRTILLGTALAVAGCTPGPDTHTGHHRDHDHGVGHHHGQHVNDATLIVRTHPSRPRAGEPVTLQLMIHTTDGRMVSDFEVAHEAKLHLVIVRDGLDTFDHLHPRVDAHGNLTVEHEFPAGGTYRLFADFVEAGKGPAVATTTVTVGGGVSPAAPLVANAPGRVAADGFEVDVRAIESHGGTRLDFAVLADERPVTDIRPYLGAPGHLVLVGATNGQYVHVHPSESNLQHGRITFEAHFPGADTYKGWLQFRHNGRVHTVPFVLSRS